jgi:hypothetical protein
VIKKIEDKKMALDKIKEIARLLDGKGEILIRNDVVSGVWYVHCWWEDGYRDIHNQFTPNLDKTLDLIIEKLGGTE